MKISPTIIFRCLIVVLFATSQLTAGTTLSVLGDPSITPNVYTIAGASHANVGALQVNAADGTFGCSGTLIADGSWVLTAGHCADGATGGNTTFSLDPQVGNSGASWFLGSQTHQIVEVVSHPKWDGSLNRGYDIALMRLADQVSGVAPAQLYTDSNELGQQATIVGYGMYGTDIDGVIGLDGNRRAGLNMIDNFWRTGGKSSRLLAIDFDNGVESAFGTDYPENPELFSVFGDSGGPVLIGDLVAGVNSFLGDANGDGKYGTAGDYSGHTRVSEFSDWITSVTGTSTSGGGDGNDGGGPPPGRGGGRFNSIDPIALTARPIALTATAPVPEPGALWLMLSGVVLLALRRRARR